jgi:hypothetical protein
VLKNTLLFISLFHLDLYDAGQALSNAYRPIPSLNSYCVPIMQVPNAVLLPAVFVPQRLTPPTSVMHGHAVQTDAGLDDTAP